MNVNTGQVSASTKFQSAEFIRPQRTKIVFCIVNVSIRRFIVEDLGVDVVSFF